MKYLKYRIALFELLKKLIFLLLFIPAQHARAQEPVYWQLTDEDGLPSMTVYQLLQDEEGYIWMGTANGLYRYDGKDFKYYRHPSLIDEEIIDLIQGPMGRIWFSNLARQLFYIEDGRVQIYVDISPEDNSKLQDRVQFFENNLLLGFADKTQIIRSSTIYIIPIGSSIPKFEDQQFRKKTIPFSFNQFSIVNNTLFINNLYGPYYQVSKDSITPHYLPIVEKTVSNWSHSSPSHHYIFGDTYFIRGKKDLFTWQYGKPESFRRFSPEKIINEIIPFGNDIWVLSSGGIFILNKRTISPSKKPLFPDLSLNSMMVDSEGSIWLATTDNGVLIIPSKNIARVALSSKNYQTYFIDTKDDSKEIYSGHKQGIFRIIDSESLGVKEEIKVSATAGRILAIMVKDTLMIASDDALSYSLPSTPEQFISIPYSKAIKTFLIDDKKNFWLGDFNSTRKFKFQDISRIKDFRKIPVVLKKRTYALCQDFSGVIWIGTSTGIYQYRNGEVTPFLESDSTAQPYYVKNIVQTKDSTIWIATNSDGLLKIRNDNIVYRYNKNNAFPTNICNDLFVDTQGELWLATIDGLFRINPETEQFTAINKYDGLPTNVINTVAVKDSTVWVGSPKGMYSFPKSAIRKNETPPPVYISKMFIEEKDTLLRDSYRLRHHQNSLEFHFWGLGYRSRGDLSFEYQMIGLDTAWLETKTDFVRFSGLNAGHYVFNVVAINEDGVRSEVPASITFDILPAWWNTRWFRVLALFTVLFLGWLIFFLRYKSIQKKEKVKLQFQKKVNELKMQALQTQMNPHFIFNALNAIQKFLSDSDEENAMDYLASFGSLIRMVFEQSKKRKISFEEELEFLNLYLSLEKLRFREKVNINIEIEKPAEDYLDDFRFPPLLIQPIVENAFQHGLMHKTEPGQLDIRFELQGKSLKCTIEDNGVGRQKANSLGKWKKKGHNPSGLKTTKERLALLHKVDVGSKEFAQYFSIVDLFNDQGEAIGTQVNIML